MTHAQRNLAAIRAAARELDYRCPECYKPPTRQAGGRWKCITCSTYYELDELVRLGGDDE